MKYITHFVRIFPGHRYSQESIDSVLRTRTSAQWSFDVLSHSSIWYLTCAAVDWLAGGTNHWRAGESSDRHWSAPAILLQQYDDILHSQFRNCDQNGELYLQFTKWQSKTRTGQAEDKVTRKHRKSKPSCYKNIDHHFIWNSDQKINVSTGAADDFFFLPLFLLQFNPILKPVV